MNQAAQGQPISYMYECYPHLSPQVSIWLSIRTCRLTANDLDDGLHDADAQNTDAKEDTYDGRRRLPTATAQFEIAQWRQDIGEGTSRGGADQLEDGTQVAGQQRQRRRRDHQRRREEEVPFGIPGSVGKIVVGHDLAAHKGLEWKGREHVKAEAAIDVVSRVQVSCGMRRRLNGDLTIEQR